MENEKHPTFIDGVAVGENRQRLNSKQATLIKRIEKLKRELVIVEDEIQEVEKYIRHHSGIL